MGTGILAFTGKDRYESGDIQIKVVEQAQQEEQEENDAVSQDINAEPTPPGSPVTAIMPVASVATLQQQNIVQQKLDLRIDPEFETWDRLFRESCTEDELDLIYSDMPIDN